jgi:hypothetical protein
MFNIKLFLLNVIDWGKVLGRKMAGKIQTSLCRPPNQPHEEQYNREKFSHDMYSQYVA